MDPSPYGSEAPKEFATKRFKIVWRVLLISNLALGAYMFAMARKKDMAAVNKGVKNGTVNGEGTKSVKVEDVEGAKSSKIEGVDGAKTSKIEDTEGARTEKDETKPIPPDLSTLSEFALATEEPVFPTVTMQPVKVARKPIPEDEQRDLFKWILEDKRKITPKDREEKKRIDEEKAILKQFIRAEKIPKFITDDCFDSSLRDWDKFFSQ